MIGFRQPKKASRRDLEKAYDKIFQELQEARAFIDYVRSCKTDEDWEKLRKAVATANKKFLPTNDEE